MERYHVRVSIDSHANDVVIYNISSLSVCKVTFDFGLPDFLYNVVPAYMYPDKYVFEMDKIPVPH